MALAQTYYSQTGSFHGDSRSLYGRNQTGKVQSATYNHYNADVNHLFNNDNSHDFNRNLKEYSYTYDNTLRHEAEPSLKRRKSSASCWESSGRYSQAPNACPHVPSKQQRTCHNVPLRNPGAYDQVYSTSIKNSATTTTTLRPHADAGGHTSSKRDRSWLEDTETDNIFLSRAEIERCSPSRKDGIDPMHEAHLRYSYCAFLQNLGFRLDLPQTTIGTAMVLCHRFFVRRSHACHDRFLIATAALFLAAKSEETARPLNDVLTASCEIFHKQNLALLSYLLPVDWFEQYRERVTEAEQMILTTLNFELNVQHPYEPLTSTLEKLGFSETVLVNLALNLVSEGLRSSLWLQFKPYQIAAGAAYLASKFLNMDMASHHSVWKAFQTPPNVLRDVAQQLMELF